jgi:hypothetical protein
MMRSLFLLLLAAAGCVGADSGRTPEAEAQTAPAGTPVARGGDSAASETGEVAAAADTGAKKAHDMKAVRGLYVNRWATQSPARMRYLVGLADQTEVNALVLDMKDEFGLNFLSSDPMVSKNAGKGGVVPKLRELLDTLQAHGIMPIARIVVFKDSVAARQNPEHVIRKPDGSPWRDKQGLTWVNPYDKDIWEYNIRVAEELVRLGFQEIQFDYIRFPEPYKSLPPQVFPGAGDRTKPQVLAEFLKTACPRIHTLGAGCTADIFGLVTTVSGALEVGQQWETLAPVTDVLLPMVYPSHYPRGSFGIARPNAEPYQVIVKAITRAHERNAKLGLAGRENVRPWLQAFSLGQPEYGAEQIREQKRAVYDSGYDGWILWHPGSKYEIFAPALEKTLVSRKKASVETAAAAGSAPR